MTGLLRSTRLIRTVPVLAALAAWAVADGLTAPISAGTLDADGYASPVKSLSAKLPGGQQRAFPTAEGHGAAARGGRGGQVIFVTTLADSGEGSLRACIEAAGPRTCVFRISGTITLNRHSLVAENPFLTIAGETAPGDGIAIRNSPIQLRPSLEIKTHDVIVRHIRLRAGPHALASCCSGALGLYTKNAHDIIFDHLSASWGSDETIDSEHASNVTFQWSIVSEPLVNGGPGKKKRARNMLLTKGGNFTIHNTLFALGRFRNPQIAPTLPDSTIDLINNVLYSPVWDYVISLDNRWAPISANIIGNYKIAGRRQINDRLVHLFEKGDNEFRLYLARNFDETYALEEQPPQLESLEPDVRGFAVPDRVAEPNVVIVDAHTAYKRVLAAAGATKPQRDQVDRRIVDEVRRREGRFLKNNPQDAGGWPVLRSAEAPPDNDLDGMADAWEVRWGLDPTDPSDGRMDLDDDGWTNFEEYLHELAGDGAGMQKPRAGSN